MLQCEALLGYLFWNVEAGVPEEKGQSLEKGLEVVVVIYGGLLIQLDVPKHLKQQESRWCLHTQTPKI